MIHLQGAFLVRGAAQFAPTTSTFQDFVANTAGDVPCGKGTMREYSSTPLRHIFVLLPPMDFMGTAHPFLEF